MPKAQGLVRYGAPNPFLMRTLLRFFFYLLYHPFAFTYDLVAASVSLGRWKDWVSSVIPFIEGNRILEIGHGPGHLQRLLLSRNLLAVGLDESAAMGRLAKRNLTSFLESYNHHSNKDRIQHIDYTQVNLTRGLAQQLPFPNNSFDTVVATFPTEYIFALETLEEAHRVLTDSGRFVILPSATIVGRGILDRVMALIFHITGQTTPNLSELLEERTKALFGNSGFHMQVHELDIKSSLVFVIVATKSSR
jgi:ubiquinone/menaquinone biosynthesis C-methylase UbiE